MTRSILVSVSRDCSVVAETSLLGDGGTLDRGSTGIILGPEGGMVPLLLRGRETPFAEGNGRAFGLKFQSSRFYLQISNRSGTDQIGGSECFNQRNGPI